ncbi:MAG: type II secretion system protein GspE [Acidithiobacillales bacterium SG8_45]|nr:MAG: type II secretion system protein GspE [Acidithiobacillales bacterium SG8_45]
MSVAEALILDTDVVKQLPYHFAKRHGVILSSRESDHFNAWVRRTVTSEILAEIDRSLGLPVRPTELDDEAFSQALNKAYERGVNQAADMVGDFGDDIDLSSLTNSLPKVEDLLESEDDAPIIRLINALLSQAVRDNASDIHLEPFESRSVVRFRLDGVLRDIMEPQQKLHGLLVSRIKVMARLDIAEKRLPQDGRISLRLAGRPVDIRVSTLPTAHGERVVMRLLDKQAGRLQLSNLGMADSTLADLRELIHLPHGIILVTGPTGSGKTTTLYAMLSQLDTQQHNIMTVEDPIEYNLDGVGQTQVNSKINLSFASALRALLRQDPDIIMIGEIRDLETAQIAVQASLTGHLVLATLHTNDSIGAVTRLIDMGVEPFLVASSLGGVLAQRLVRKICPACRKPHHPTESEIPLLEIPKASAEEMSIYTADGCEQCANSGYLHRTGIYELLTIDDHLRGMIHDCAAEGEIRKYASKLGMRNLRQDGLRWVRQGDTSLEELVRVTRE